MWMKRLSLDMAFIHPGVGFCRGKFLLWKPRSLPTLPTLGVKEEGIKYNENKENSQIPMTVPCSSHTFY